MRPPRGRCSPLRTRFLRARTAAWDAGAAARVAALHPDVARAHAARDADGIVDTARTRLGVTGLTGSHTRAAARVAAHEADVTGIDAAHRADRHGGHAAVSLRTLLPGRRADAAACITAHLAARACRWAARHAQRGHCRACVAGGARRCIGRGPRRSRVRRRRSGIGAERERRRAGLGRKPTGVCRRLVRSRTGVRRRLRQESRCGRRQAAKGVAVSAVCRRGLDTRRHCRHGAARVHPPAFGRQIAALGEPLGAVVLPSLAHRKRDQDEQHGDDAKARKPQRPPPLAPRCPRHRFGGHSHQNASCIPRALLR